MARHRDQISGWLWVLPSLAIPLVISAVAWTNHVASEGVAIAPNVMFAGVDLSGLTLDVATAHVGWRETAFRETPVTIDLGDRQMTLRAADIGFDYRYTDTINALISARHDETVWREFASWISTPFETVTVPDEYVLDEDLARARLSEDDLILETPTEPSLASEQGQVTVVPGIDGLGVDIDHLIERLKEADIASGPIEVTARLESLPPVVSDADAGVEADEANELTKDGLIAVVNGSSRRLGAAAIRRHLSSDSEDGRMTLSLDLAGFQQDIERLFPGPQGEMEKPLLEVVEGEVQVLQEGVPPPVCCSTESVRAAADDFLSGGEPRFQLETRPNGEERVVRWATGLDVNEVVAEFTTHHACCENRVSNIQTMADAVRGYYLIPGETLSFNDYIGPRTRDKGYLPAGAIRSGHMTDEVGGGVSQFVTTMFNAAFFGGLDLDEYQSHSVYFSRYPFGREATLSMPGPDLVVTNSTGYPVLIWPTYDSTSITVTLYSTKHIDVQELDQRVTFRRQCRHSEIDRQRTYPDGRVVVDTIEANYRPGDGIDCNGNEIPPLRR